MHLKWGLSQPPSPNISTELSSPGDPRPMILDQMKVLKNIDTIVVANAPVRIDLAGGWSDTPPICYETAGAVSISNMLI